MKKPGVLKKIVFSLLPCALLLIFAEAGLRFSGAQFQVRQKELNLPMVAAFFGTMQLYFPVVLDGPDYLWIRGAFVAGQNPDGTYNYIWPVEKQPDRIRVAFIGGSTVENLEGSMFESFPELCVSLLNEVAGTNRYEALNVGCSSYSSHQSLLALQRYVLPRHPDVVVLYDGWNDFEIKDGYSEREKDFLINFYAKLGWASGFMEWAQNLRLSQLLGFVAQKFEVWPKPRSTPMEFRENLEKAARLVAAAGARPVVVLKPISRSLPINDWSGTPEMLKVFGPELGATSEAIYQGVHRYATDAQRFVVSNVPGARLADVETRLNLAQDEIENDPHEGVAIFLRDALHCTAIGNYFVAEAVARAVAPEMAEQIERYAASSTNWRRMAENLLRIQSPFEATYAAAHAIRLDSSLEPEMQPLMEQARHGYEFMRCFSIGRWDNALAISWEERMDMLGKCLKMRPGDLGVAIQIMRVSMYLGHLPDAAGMMENFEPANEQDRVEWLDMCFQSHMAGERLAMAEWVAAQIMAIDPQREAARAFLINLQNRRQLGL